MNLFFSRTAIPQVIVRSNRPESGKIGVLVGREHDVFVDLVGDDKGVGLRGELADQLKFALREDPTEGLAGCTG